MFSVDKTNKIKLLVKEVSDTLYEFYKEKYESFSLPVINETKFGKIYKSLLSLSWMILRAPEGLILKVFKGYTGTILKFGYYIFVMPFRALINLMDIENYVNFFYSIFDICFNCLYKGILVNIFNWLFDKFSIIANLLKNSVGLSQNIQRIRYINDGQKRRVLKKLFDYAKKITNTFTTYAKKIVFKSLSLFDKILFNDRIYETIDCLKESLRFKKTGYIGRIESIYAIKFINSSIVQNTLVGYLASLGINVSSIKTALFVLVSFLSSFSIVSWISLFAGIYIFVYNIKTFVQAFGSVE